MMKTIYVVGDSTVATNIPPYYGWGGQMAPLIENVKVVNLARSGYSSKSFWEEGHFKPVEASMRTGDLLLIGFGHNDEKDDLARHTEPETTYPETLLGYVSAARNAGALPVLCTSVSRCYFVGAESDFLLYTHGEYPAAVRHLCKRESIALIDLEKETRALLLSLGVQKSLSLFVNLAPGEHPDYPAGIEDKTHFSLLGAQMIAKMVVNNLYAMGYLEL